MSKKSPKPKPSSVPRYLTECSPADRVMLNAVRDVILANLDEGFVETMAWGFPSYQVPLDVYTEPDGAPLVYAAIEAEKRGCKLYLTSLYNGSEAEAEFHARWKSPSRRMVEFRATAVKFREVRDLDLPLIGEFVAAMTPDEFVASYHRTKD